MSIIIKYIEVNLLITVCYCYSGDNALTAISVSRECRLVDESAEIYVPRFLRGSSTDPNSQLAWESVLSEGQALDNSSLEVSTHTEIYIDVA